MGGAAADVDRPSPAQPLTRNLGATAVLAALALLLVSRLASFGIWDPWELKVAEHARQLAEGLAVPDASLSAHAASLGFRAFGTYEWAGRLPIAVCALLTALLTFAMVSRRVGTRAGCYAAIVLGTTPMFVLNARALAGVAPAFLLQTAVAWAGLEALAPSRRPWERALWSAMAAASSLLCAWGVGALGGPLPPLLGIAAMCLLLHIGRDPQRRATATLFVSAAAGVLAATVAAVVADSAESVPWTGGPPQGVAPPSYDAMLERVLHAGAPWSALLPVAIGALSGMGSGPRTGTGPEREARLGLQLVAVTWAAAGYVASTLFLARYGEAASYLPAAALAIVVALFLDETTTKPMPRRGAGIAVLLLVGLLIRDYSLFPESAIKGLTMASFSLPDNVNPKRVWTPLLSGFGALAMLVLAVGNQTPRLEPAAPYALLRRQWARDWGHRAWLLALGGVLLSLVIAAATTWLAPSALGVGVLGQKLLKRLGLAVAALPLAVLAIQTVLWAVGRAQKLQVPALLAVGTLAGAYAGHGFLPTVSGQLSPKRIYETYNALAGPGESLAEYGSDGRAAAYYVKGDVIGARRVADVVEHLTGEGRRWATFPKDELGRINRLYRKQTQAHLVVVDGKHARVVLATNRAVPNTRDQNYFATRVLREAPAMQHTVGAMFDDRIELLGYNLELPHEGYVGAGERFTITWYFKVHKRMSTSPKVFVHVDRGSQRIHGDHEPLAGRLPMRLWEPGDVIVDRHRLEAQANLRTGTYEVFVGLYSGDTRTQVSDGPSDGSNRVKAGVLRIR